MNRIAILAVLALAFGCAKTEPETGPPPTAAEVAQFKQERIERRKRLDPVGRYQIVTNPFSNKNLFLLDTRDGRVWQAVAQEGDRDGWQEQQVEHLTASVEEK